MVRSEAKQKDNYGLQVALSSLVLFAILVSLVYKLKQNEPIAYNALAPVVNGKQIYMLKSKTTAKLYHQNSTSMNNYGLNLDRFKSYISSLGHSVKYIAENEIESLKKSDILFILDAISLKNETKESIKSFLKSGGNLYFNFTSGFSDEDGNLLGDKFVNDITNLNLSEQKSYLFFKDGLTITQRVLSVLDNKDSGILLDAYVSDNIPIFKTPKYLKSDIFMTNYSQISPPIDKNENYSLTVDEAGCGWHGYYGSGKWFYMNLPSYIFYNSKKVEYKSMLNSIINYFSTDIVVGKFPYIDKEKVVFISEDTEYKFENFEKFNNLSKKYQIPVTAFLVSSLTTKDEHKNMVKKIAKNPLLEFASHSRSHKKIVGMDESYVIQETSETKQEIESVAPNMVTGFRPPREELDELMKQNLSTGGFEYVLSGSKEYLYPQFDKNFNNLLIIPRHGTDDYNYLINLDWSSDQIVEQIIKETKFVTTLGGIFTLSMHTHLFAFKSNIKIVDKYFRYLKQHKEFTPMSGKTITKKVKDNQNIDLTYEISDKQLIINIVNNNNHSINHFHCKVFKKPNLKVRSIKSQQTHVKKYRRGKSEFVLNINRLSPNDVTTIYINFM
jgi:peptidoglycan/xylan/chitin deacetylase (PgdA/CDA1 family)